MTGCPSADELERLLDAELGDSDARQLGEHVADCASCQATLDGLTSAGATQSDSVAPRTTAADPEPALVALLARMREVPPDPRPAAEPTPSTDHVHFPGAATTDAPLGQLGSYQILSRLGSGANGVLFKARDEKLGRIVAIKVLRRELATIETARARFEREARAAASLNHDNVVTMHDVVTTSDFPPYLVMEYIAGESLSERLKREGTLEPREAVRVVQQVAIGLAAAHERGLVHRDIKPSNIMLEPLGAASQKTASYDYRAKITDFGLARGPEMGAPITREGAIAGTPAYMSPEQVTSPQDVDARSDIYSLGVVLYELLTGEVPFRGMVRMILSQVVNDEPRPPSRLNDKVPADVETICLKALAKQRSRRYATAAALAADLRRWLAGEPIRARSVGAMERLSRWSKRNLWIARLSAVVAVLLVAVGVSSAIARMRISAARLQTDDALASERRARYEVESANREAKEERRKADAVVKQEQKLRKDSDQKREDAENARRESLDTLDAERQARIDADERRRAADESLLKLIEQRLPCDLSHANETHVPLLVAAAQLAGTLGTDAALPPERADELRTLAARALRAVIRIEPENEDAWSWRELLVRQLLLMSAAATREPSRESLRREAGEILAEAIAAAPAERRPGLERLSREIAEP